MRGAISWAPVWTACSWPPRIVSDFHTHSSLVRSVKLKPRINKHSLREIFWYLCSILHAFPLLCQHQLCTVHIHFDYVSEVYKRPRRNNTNQVMLPRSGRRNSNSIAETISMYSVAQREGAWMSGLPVEVECMHGRANPFPCRCYYLSIGWKFIVCFEGSAQRSAISTWRPAISTSVHV